MIKISCTLNEQKRLIESIDSGAHESNCPFQDVLYCQNNCTNKGLLGDCEECLLNNIEWEIVEDEG